MSVHRGGPPPTIPDDRRAEFDGLVRFMMQYALPGDAQSRPLAERLALGCLGPEHLWRNLDLPSRDHLSTLFERHFPRLKAENHKDMRWKKFLYRRLCGWEGFSH